MAWTASTWAIQRPLTPLVLFTVITAYGILGWFRLPVQAMPAVIAPVVQITLTQNGASPADLEEQVTRRIEASLGSIDGIKKISSSITRGTSVTEVEFHLSVNPDRATTDVRDAISRIRSTLPAGMHDPEIEQVEISGTAILTIAVSSEGRSESDLSWFVDDIVSKDLRTVHGVASVRREGGVNRELGIELDLDHMQALGLSADEIDDSVRSSLASWPGGQAVIPGQDLPIRVQGGSMASGIEALRGMTVSLPGGRHASLGDLGTVVDGASAPRSIARVDGHHVVGFSVYRSNGVSEVSVAQAVLSRLDSLRTANPWARFQIETDWVQPTRDAFHGALFSLLEGSVLAVLAVGLFLRNWRATMIAAVAIPLSVIPTFAVMQLLGFSLDGISLLAISLVSGVLVDDAIVEIENIIRFQQHGQSSRDAAIAGASRIGIAVIATTAAIDVVFLPVSAMPGIAGRYFVEFGITVAVAVSASLLVARLMTPMMCAFLLPVRPGRSDVRSPLRSALHTFLSWCLRHRKTVLTCGIAWMALTVVLVPLLPTGFYISGDHSQSTIQVELPPGVTLEQADQTATAVTAALKAQPEVKTVFAHIEVPLMSFTVTLVPPRLRTVSVREFEDRMRPVIAQVPDQRTSFLDDRGSRDVSIQLLGDDRDQLTTVANDLVSAMARLPQLSNVTATSGQSRSELVILPRSEAAARLGVDPQRLARIVQVATTGNDDLLLPQISIGSRLVPVRVHVDRRAQGIERIASLRVPTATGTNVPLSAVADLSIRESAASLERDQQTHSIGIEADLAPDTTLGEAIAAASALEQWKHLPTGMRILPSGDVESMVELFHGFMFAGIFGACCVYLVLVLLYRDTFHPMTIMVSIPLCFGGALIALLIGGKPLDLSALIGALMLMGIVTKNAILVIDEALQQRAGGKSRHDALIGASVIRSRPVLMTTLAMVAGMLPVLFGVAPDAAFRSAMAMTVIGGLISSTLLSLVFVPVVFTVIDDVREWVLTYFRPNAVNAHPTGYEP